MWVSGRGTVLFWGPKNILDEITLFLKNDAQMDPNWVPKPNKINKNSNEICGKVQRIVSNTNAYNRISVVWGGGDDTPHGVFDKTWSFYTERQKVNKKTSIDLTSY